MDPASLGPRLCDVGEDSIVVHDPKQHQSDAALSTDYEFSSRSDDDEEEEEDAPLGNSEGTPAKTAAAAAAAAAAGAAARTDATTSSIYTSPTSAANRHSSLLPDSTSSAPIAISIAPNLTPTTFVSPAPSGAVRPQDPQDLKRPRACEACRGLKVKCEPELSNLDGPCKRCAKSGRNCEVTQPTRKRHKKTDSRVTELEKKIDALTASLQASREAGAAASQPPPQPSVQTSTHQSRPPARSYSHPPRNSLPPRSTEPQEAEARPAKEWGVPTMHVPNNGPKDEKTTMAGQKRKYSSETISIADRSKSSAASSMSSSIPQQPLSDVIDREIITLDEASLLFRRYTDRMAPHLPAVVFPHGTTVVGIRKPQPILFLAIMAVASSETPNIQRRLMKELMQIFADEVIVHGRKSIELVQALMLSVIWYFPPEHFEELKFYQLVHIAAVMAIDMGLGRRKNSPKSSLIPYTWRDHPFRKTPLPDPSTIESRRVWLSVYFLASNVAMALHRPNLIAWQSFTTECMDILESSPDAAPSDRYLCHLVWTHRLAEEAGIQFSMDDPGVFVNIAEQKVQYTLRGFERDLTKYLNNVSEEDRQPSLLLSFNVMSLYMHEIALQSNEEFTATNPEFLREPISGLSDSLTAAQIGALSSCLTAIDGIFEIFLSLDVATIRCLPIFNFVRVAYAIIVLIKIYYSASSDSELGKIIDKDNMKVAEYIDQLLKRFKETAAQDKSRPAGKFVVVLTMVHGWFNQHGQSRSQSGKAAPSVQKSTRLPRNDPNPKPGTSRAGVPLQHPHMQLPQDIKPPEFNTANTPLQVLSEIATSNNPSQNIQHSRVQPPPMQPAQTFPGWYGPGEAQVPYTFGSGSAMTTSAGDTVVNQQPFMPWTGGMFNADMDILGMGMAWGMGDGLEQAMDLTMTGFGGGSPGDPGRYQDAMRMMPQSDPRYMGGSAPESFPGNNDDGFGFR